MSSNSGSSGTNDDRPIGPGARRPGRAPGRAVLDGAFRILHALPETPRRGQVSRLAMTTGLPRPTVYRLLGQLRDVGAVVQVAGVYKLAPSIAELGVRAHAASSLRETAANPMRILRERSGATVCLISATPSGGVVLDMVDGLAALPVRVREGQDMPVASAGVEVLEGPQTVAHDDRRLLRDLTCYAVAVDLGSNRRASLAIMTPAQDPASRYDLLTQLTASRITEASRLLAITDSLSGGSSAN